MTRLVQVLYAADCAERVLPLFERAWPADDRPRKAIEAARAYSRGEIDYAALLTALRAAGDAAVRGHPAADAPRAAAAHAAWAAASVAAGLSAGAALDAAAAAAAAAAGGAARDADWDDAWAAAWDAEREWQTERLRQYTGEGEA